MNGELEPDRRPGSADSTTSGSTALRAEDSIRPNAADPAADRWGALISRRAGARHVGQSTVSGAEPIGCVCSKRAQTSHLNSYIGTGCPLHRRLLPVFAASLVRFPDLVLDCRVTIFGVPPEVNNLHGTG